MKSELFQTLFAIKIFAWNDGSASYKSLKCRRKAKAEGRPTPERYSKSLP